MAWTDHPPDPKVLVSANERFLWCKLPTSVSTSWKSYFLKGSGEDVAGTENWNGPRITTLAWLRFEHPAFIFASLDIHFLEYAILPVLVRPSSPSS